MPARGYDAQLAHGRGCDHHEDTATIDRGDAVHARRVLITFGIGALALLGWYLADVLLLAFAAVLLAVLMRASARGIRRVVPLPMGAAITLVALLIVALLAVVGGSFGYVLHAQVAELLDRFRQGWESIGQRLQGYDLGARLFEMVQSATPDGSGLVARAVKMAGSFAGALVSVLIVAFGGLYLALSPDVYRQGLAELLPAGARDHVADTLDSIGEALRLWLIGQLVAMVIVGVLTGLGLWLIGVPSALALGALAGVADFVPFVGPVVAAVPAVVVALGESPTTALWAIVVWIAVQQIESHVIIPLITRRTVDIAPAFTLFAVLGAGALFGMPGVLLATPLAVCVVVAVKKLWVRETLGVATEVPGEHETDGARGDADASRDRPGATRDAPAASPARAAATPPGTESTGA